MSGDVVTSRVFNVGDIAELVVEFLLNNHDWHHLQFVLKLM